MVMPVVVWKCQVCLRDQIWCMVGVNALIIPRVSTVKNVRIFIMTYHGDQPLAIVPTLVKVSGAHFVGGLSQDVSLTLLFHHLGCECNGHSSQCRYDSAVYEASGRVSGGVCINCQHNTIGTNCNLCREYFYQDPTRRMDDPEICQREQKSLLFFAYRIVSFNSTTLL